MVGNGATNWDLDVFPTFPETLYNFNIIPKTLLDQYNSLNCTYYFNDLRNHSGPAECDALFDKFFDFTDGLNWYDLYRTDAMPLLQKDRAEFGEVIIDGEKKTYQRGYKMSQYTPWLKKHFESGLLKDKHLGADVFTDWLNRADVRTALHIPSTAPAWSMCWNDTTQAGYHYAQEGSQWIYTVLKQNGIRLMHYSGDTDGAITTYGTKSWIETLGWPTKVDWKQWRTDGQVSGYVQQYDGLDFVTVKGVGHMAPQWAKKPVLQMITNWIHNIPWA